MDIRIPFWVRKPNPASLFGPREKSHDRYFNYGRAIPFIKRHTKSAKSEMICNAFLKIPPKFAVHMCKMFQRTTMFAKSSSAGLQILVPYGQFVYKNILWSIHILQIPSSRHRNLLQHAQDAGVKIGLVCAHNNSFNCTSNGSTSMIVQRGNTQHIFCAPARGLAGVCSLIKYTHTS